MAPSSVSLSSSPTLIPSLFNLKPRFALLSRISRVPLTFSPLVSSKKIAQFQDPHLETPPRNTPLWKISAVSEDVLLSDDNPIGDSQQIVPTNVNGDSAVVSALLLFAFAGLVILTVGVIYLSVTDFLQKRETERFEKEEASKKKKKRSGKRRVRSRAGPRGFGQKIDEDNDYDDED